MKNLRNMLLVLIISLISSNVFGQSNPSGNWLVGEQNTVVKIYKGEAGYIGKVVSSDNPKVKVGKLMVKELEQKKGKWEGKVYSPKRKEWYDAEFTKNGDKLNIEISVGFFSKNVEWVKKQS